MQLRAAFSAINTSLRRAWHTQQASVVNDCSSGVVARSFAAAAAAQSGTSGSCGSGNPSTGTGSGILSIHHRGLASLTNPSTRGSGCLVPASTSTSTSSLAAAANPRRGLFAVADVRGGGVEAAFARLHRHCQDEGLYAELRKREYRETNHELAFIAKRAKFNRRMGKRIRDRLRWVVKRHYT